MFSSWEPILASIAQDAQNAEGCNRLEKIMSLLIQPCDVCPSSDLGNGGSVQWSGKSSCLGQQVPSPHSISAFGP
jgi:hypothetical protein